MILRIFYSYDDLLIDWLIDPFIHPCFWNSWCIFDSSDSGYVYSEFQSADFELYNCDFSSSDSVSLNIVSGFETDSESYSVDSEQNSFQIFLWSPEATVQKWTWWLFLPSQKQCFVNFPPARTLEPTESCSCQLTLQFTGCSWSFSAFRPKDGPLKSP